jgi:hypothetical protein
MAVTISNDEYAELQTLRSYYIREKNIESIKSTEFLELDIDIPMRTIVGMFALLGCRPLFSCCGFDYSGQPIHKTHEYGNAYVMLDNNTNTQRIIEVLSDHKFLVEDKEKTSQWRTWTDERHNISFIALAFDWAERNSDYPWTMKNCIHYSEKGVIGLNELRKVLYRFQYSFLDEFILEDTNEKQNKYVPYWQYPSLKPWTISREQLLKDIERELAL